MIIVSRGSPLKREYLLLLALAVLNCSVEINAVPTLPKLRLMNIVGGSCVPRAHSTPFMVSIQHNGVHYCAGSIIKRNWVLTAAHCLSAREIAMSSVLVAGSGNIVKLAETKQKRNVGGIVIHDLYTGVTMPYDIGLIYTSTPFEWTAAVSAITLPVKHSTASGSGDLYGWGSTSTTREPSYPNELHMARNLPIIDFSNCSRSLGAKGNDVHSTNLCTGELTGSCAGICSSDSGGPLVQKVNGQTVLVGIVSWGKIPCGQPNSPSVYGKVSAHIDWIKNNQVIPRN